MLIPIVAVALAGADVVPLAGVEFAPLSRGDLVLIDDGRTTGTGVGELDGTVRPTLTAFGGAWIGRWIGVTGTLGVARLQSTTWTGDVFHQRHWGVVRPAIDLRVSLTRREARRPALWALVGSHGDIPSARDVSNGFTTEEQEAADELATVERIRLGGVGARLGAGVDYRLGPGLAIGAMYALEWHRGVLRTSEASTVTSWLAARGAITLTFEWDRKDGS